MKDDRERPAAEELWRIVQAQQEGMTALRTELEQLRARLGEAGGATTDRPRHGELRLSRGGLLRAAAVGAAGLAGAGMLRGAEPAAAADGASLTLGSGGTTNNHAESTTRLAADHASGQTTFNGSTLFVVDASNVGTNGTQDIDGLQGIGNHAGSGLTAQGGLAGGTGVYGLAGHDAGGYGTGVVGVVDPSALPNTLTYQNTGVYGGAGANGVWGVGNSTLLGASPQANGVYAQGIGSQSAGVYATSDQGYAVFAQSTTGMDLFAGGTGILRLLPQAAAGTPNLSNALTGELVTDSRGIPYAYYAGIGGGSPGWQAVGNLRSFPNPRRVYAQSMTNGQTSVPIDATVTVGSVASGVPAGALAAYAAVQSYQPGVMTVFPDGGTDPGIANWSGTGNIPGVLNLLYMLVPLSSAGKFRIHTYFNGSVYVDVWGYLL